MPGSCCDDDEDNQIGSRCGDDSRATMSCGRRKIPGRRLRDKKAIMIAQISELLAPGGFPWSCAAHSTRVDDDPAVAIDIDGQQIAPNIALHGLVDDCRDTTGTKPSR